MVSQEGVSPTSTLPFITYLCKQIMNICANVVNLFDKYATNGPKMYISRCFFLFYRSSTALDWVIFEKGGTLCVSQMLPPMTEPRPMVIRPNTEALE